MKRSAPNRIEPSSESSLTENDDDDEDSKLFPSTLNVDGDNDPSVTQAHRQTAQELTQLSVAERERVFFDLHGISHPFPETTENVAEALQKLEVLLQQRVATSIHQRPLPAYIQALQQYPAYIQDSSFRLLFLRADDFDVEAAATRLWKFCETKRELFGNALLGKPSIRQDDLDPRAVSFLESGCFQQLPVRDMSGRLVTLLFYDLQDSSIHVKVRLQRIFYGAMVSLEEEETQRFGNVFVGVGPTNAKNSQNKKYSADRPFLHSVARIMSALPAKCHAIHVCWTTPNSSWMLPVLALFQRTAASMLRLRLRTHVGDSLIHTRYMLQTFGIPACTLPISEAGDEILTRDNLRKWRQRRAWERAQDQKKRPASTTTTTNNNTSLKPPNEKVNETTERDGQDLTPTNTPKSVEQDQTTSLVAQQSQSHESSSSGTRELAGDVSPFDDSSSSSAITLTGRPSNNNLGTTQQQEEETSSDSNQEVAKAPLRPLVFVGTPTKHDVLLGRGRLFQEHVGNIRFRFLVQERLHSYNQADKRGKKEWHQQVVQCIYDQQGRFLQPDGLGWKSVDVATALAKAGACFRSLRRNAILQQKKLPQPSS